MNSDSLIYKVVRAYYEKGMTQQAIANRYGISRIKVSRLLAKAQKEKIVQIKIIEPDNPYIELEHELEEKYQLDELIIVENPDRNTEDWISRAGFAAAEYLTSVITGNEIIGLTWGRSLLSLVDNLPLQHYPDLKVVQMLGGLGQPQSGSHGADLTRRMAQSFGTRPWLIHSPGIVKNSTICKELKNDIQVKDTLNMAVNADIAIVGIGLFDKDSQLIRDNNILSAEEFNQIKKAGAVGDISLRFFNRKGEFISTPLDDRVVGISSDELRAIPRIIGIAGGDEKYEVLRAAVKAKLVNVLITDNITAQKLLNEN